MVLPFGDPAAAVGKGWTDDPDYPHSFLNNLSPLFSFLNCDFSLQAAALL